MQVIVGSEHYYNFHIFLKMSLAVGMSRVGKNLFGFIFGLGLAFIEDATLFFVKD